MRGVRDTGGTVGERVNGLTPSNGRARPLAAANGVTHRAGRDSGVKLITGATGTLGRALIRKIIDDSNCRVVALARSQAGVEARARLRRLLGDYISDADFDQRIEVVAGDLDSATKTLKAEFDDGLRPDIDEIFHLAASTDLGGERSDLMRANRDGTARMLDFAEDLNRKGQLKRFCYFSTAFVAGSGQNWSAPEDVMCAHPAWANAYEESKFSAELLVRAAIERGLPAIIFRPSIVVGDSGTGETSEFGLFYSIMRRFVRCSLPVFPGTPTDQIQIVPIDFVVRAAWAISGDDANIGRTYHLTSRNPPALETLIQVVTDEVPGVPDVRLVPPDRFDLLGLRPSRRAMMQSMMPYLGYLHRDLSFQTTNTESALAGTDIAMPDTGSGFVRLITSHARNAGYFGRRTVANGRARYAAPGDSASGTVSDSGPELVHVGHRGNGRGTVQP
jgi:nucleoside-diphosphate-sugar epimerase